VRNGTGDEDLLEHVASHVDRWQSVSHETDESRVQVGVKQTKSRLASFVHHIGLEQQRNYLRRKQTSKM